MTKGTNDIDKRKHVDETECQTKRRERDGAFVKGKDGGEGIFHVAFG